MGLIDIPPYVLAGESPPHHAEDRRAFHLRSWEVPEPIAFPREVFAESLAVHARLLEENGTDIVDAPAMEGRTPEYLDSINMNLACALVVSRGLKVEIHKWRPQEVPHRLKAPQVRGKPELEPGAAAAVLRAWPRAARLLEKEEAPKALRDDEKPN